MKASSQPEELAERLRAADAILVFTGAHHGLAQRQPCRRMHKNQFQQAIGTGNAASPAQRARLARLFAPIFWKQFREKLPFLF